MKNNDQFSLTLRVLIGTAAFGLSIYFIHAAAEFIIPILLAGIIVLSASPLLKWLLGKVSAEINQGNDYVRYLAGFTTEIRRYVSITTIIGLVTGLLDNIFFTIIGIPLPLLWGVFAFLLNYIPGFGFRLAAIPPTILALFEFGPMIAIIVFIGIVLINGFADEVLKPKFMGQELNLAAFMVIFSVFFCQPYMDQLAPFWVFR